jgi:DNA-binding HxlR family transcriptional regulator
MSLVDRLAVLRASASADAEDDAWAALATLAKRMEAEGRSRDDPIRAIFGLLGDRWSMLILLTLGTGEWRHATLRRIVGTLSIEGAISQRMLTLKLRTMEYDGLVWRTVSDGVPPRVSYRLTELGIGLLAQATTLLHWVGDHRGAIAESRRLFAERSEP